ncbi:MAG: hypothetical protein LUM44_21025 [Pyrinomonadaceae bacterium]|nr:hypothetical protein [Pyrinomonadaceae bacterium]
MQNRIDAVLPPERTTQMVETIRGFETELNFLIDLAREDIAGLPKMGDRGLPFVMDSLTLGEQDDSFLPRSFDIEKMRRDVALLQQLPAIIAAAEHFLELVKDTQMLVESDAYAAALEIYAAAQRSGKGEALTASLRAMGKRFDRKPKEKEEPEPPANP